MKLRSSILFACLLVVPLVAMFSHKIPREVREGFRDRVWRPAAKRVTAWVVGEPDHVTPAVERSAFAPVSPPPQASEVVPTPPPPKPTALVAAQPVAPQPPATAQPAAQPPVASAFAATPAATPPVASEAVAPPPATLPAVTLQSSLVPSASRGSLEERLAALGAVGLKLKPPDGPSAPHVASCRVPADASGQLQRLFQASGPTPETSLERLATRIEAWRSRVASADGGRSDRDAASAGPASAGPSPSGKRR